MASLVHKLTLSILLLVMVVQTCNSDSLDDLLNEQWKLVTTSYLRYEATLSFLELLKQSFPENFAYYSIGKSVQGREMHVARLGIGLDKPDVDDKPTLRPKMAFIGNIRGDETLGKQMVLMLIVDLLKGNRANDERAKRILEQTDIHMLLTMNPDGYEVAKEGECFPDENILGRLNANLKDLYTDFPHAFRQAEVEYTEPESHNALEQWLQVHTFTLSLTFSAGDIVATYPYSSIRPDDAESIPGYTGKGVASPTEDDDVFVYLATTYASNHKTMTNNGNCNKSGLFENGIINGAKLSNTRGTWQDFSYLSQCMDITVGLSCCKSVLANTFAEEWENNRESLYKYMETIHIGVKGVVSHNNTPVQYAMVFVEQQNAMKDNVYTNKFGEYWKLLLPGEDYFINAFEGGRESRKVPLKVERKDPLQALVINLELVPRLKS